LKIAVRNLNRDWELLRDIWVLIKVFEGIERKVIDSVNSP
jgi:hypothetical protein